MSGSDPIIICSSAGEHLDLEKGITVFDGSVLSVGIKVDRIELAKYVTPAQAQHFYELVDKAYDYWHAWLTAHGVPNREHPH